jgi:predicted transposase YbfD/YdcC
MVTSSIASIQTQFGGLTDPRSEHTRQHLLLDIIVIAFSAILCGADNWLEVEAFGEAKLEWFRRFLPLPNGIPSHDTFGEVFARLDPEEFQACFLSWVQAVMTATHSQVVAVDGQTVQRSHNRRLGQGPIHMVRAWAQTNRLVLAQVKVDEQSNEITAIPALLQLLDVTGCIVTIDAMGTQTAIADQIVAQGADYVLAVNDNQERLAQDVVATFAEAERVQFKQVPHDYAKTVDKGHGRLETRECWTIAREDYLDALRTAGHWRGLHSLAMVRATLQIGDEITVVTRYYISSLDGQAARLLDATRCHWGIENDLHWTLDIAFREDESRVRVGQGPENLAVLRHMALNVLKHEKTAKVGIKVKRLKAGWDEAYLLRLLAAP